MRATVLSAAENRFAVVDVFRDAVPADPEDAARTVCAAEEWPISGGAAPPVHRGIDGLLILSPPSHGGDCRMVLYNADGSRPEACGNGLRCIAKLAVERGHVPHESLVVETDGGLRTVEVQRDGATVRRASAQMGVPRIVERAVTLATTRGAIEVDLVDMGNPHCVLFVDDVAEMPVEELGAELERHVRFPLRTNVDFVFAGDDGLVVRTWERGVGETASCGSGASAAAVAAIERGLVRSPVRVRTRGGELCVEWNGRGVVRLEGPVGEPEGEISLAGGE